MRKHKIKVIGAIAILLVLSGAWFLGGAADVNVPYAAVAAAMEIEVAAEVLPFADEAEVPEAEVVKAEAGEIEAADVEEEAAIDAEDVTDVEDAETEADVQIFAAYHPEMREPDEPARPVEEAEAAAEYFTVTLEIRADMILLNMHLLHRDKHELVPPDGVIFPRTEVVAYPGESVFNVLQREMRRHGIHMSSRFTPVFNSAYVEAINNLYEFDVSALSGWMYRVNGWFPNFGASRYLLSPGDEIVWLYTVDLGRDLGVAWVEGGQDE